MATTTSITTTYAGEFAGKYIAAALLSAPTLDKGGFTIHPNVAYKQVIQRVATDDIVKNESAPQRSATIFTSHSDGCEFDMSLNVCNFRCVTK